MFDKRTSGILLHPTCFPSRFGIGDLGNEAYRFIDFLADGLQQVWQILPLGPTGYGNSPYLCYSALAGNPLLISPEKLVEDELLSEEDFAGLPDFPLDSVDFELVVQTKMPLLKKACENFKQQASEELQEEFKQFCDRASDWLEDYALFMSLKEVFEGESWNNWHKEIAKRKPDAIAKWQNQLKEPIFSQKFLQFQFFRQWNSLKEYANEKQISIFGDIPIYVAHDSVDVWANPDLFCLDEETGEAAFMAGVPPDYFSATGQLWGNPVYNWEKHQRTNFAWWMRRVEAILEYVDIIRIDHFRGFEAFWAVPQGEETAIDGEWIEAPGEAFFTLLKQKLGKLPIIAEDLGVITPEVEALRDNYGFPGMKILQFAFDSDRANPFLPFNFINRNCIVYTGTHDNDTTVGWFSIRTPEEQARVIDYLGCVCPEGIHWSLIRLALSSVANGAIFPFQDLLALGSDARMNTPSVADGNWGWRYRSEAINAEVSTHLQFLTHLYGRAPY
ncbi:4-alpha-glucanotransferase [Candidatus Gracilibacteria bacterium]|nr:4-alpha-glucanotransferase [Candidatus Gracilibacteria bacterium]NJM89641.1 4-alpha-glucanotransferase [Hydrococcus sp. RU_2_2]NJP20680.1 4-alpha-glucanotransferase [Hydrococcus sp. CRU_1_1]